MALFFVDENPRHDEDYKEKEKGRKI